MLNNNVGFDMIYQMMFRCMTEAKNKKCGFVIDPNLQRVIDEEIKKPLSKMMLFGELKDGGMIEVGLSTDVVPKLTLDFKRKVKDLKPKEEKDAKAPQ